MDLLDELRREVRDILDDEVRRDGSEGGGSDERVPPGVLSIADEVIE